MPVQAISFSILNTRAKLSSDMFKNSKKSLCVLLLFISVGSYANEQADSTNRKLKADAAISINSNGIASIPAFSLDKPAIIAAISLTKGRFSYDPVLAYGLNAKPWFIDNWLHFKLINRPVFEFRTGINFSSFFSEYKLPEKTILQSERYFALALTGIYRITPGFSLTMDYWNDRGQEKGTLKGHFISLAGERSAIGIGKHVLFTAALQFFYINYDGNNDGLFLTPRLAASLRNIPFVIFFQATQALISNISPFPGFRWNIGLAYTF